jgi:hypothetical protein
MGNANKRLWTEAKPFIQERIDTASHVLDFLKTRDDVDNFRCIARQYIILLDIWQKTYKKLILGDHTDYYQNSKNMEIVDNRLSEIEVRFNEVWKFTSGLLFRCKLMLISEKISIASSVLDKSKVNGKKESVKFIEQYLSFLLELKVIYRNIVFNGFVDFLISKRKLTVMEKKLKSLDDKFNLIWMEDNKIFLSTIRRTLDGSRKADTVSAFLTRIDTEGKHEYVKTVAIYLEYLHTLKEGYESILRVGFTEYIGKYPSLENTSQKLELIEPRFKKIWMEINIIQFPDIQKLKDSFDYSDVLLEVVKSDKDRAIVQFYQIKIKLLFEYYDLLTHICFTEHSSKKDEIDKIVKCVNDLEPQIIEIWKRSFVI